MEAAENFYGFCDCLGSEQTRAEGAIPQTGDLAVFMNFGEPSSGEAGDFQTN